MDITEAKAETKWCPFAMVAANRLSPGHNRIYGDRAPIDARCIGDRCMAWRFTGYKPVIGATAADGGPNDEAHGRCGLVGGVYP